MINHYENFINSGFCPPCPEWPIYLNDIDAAFPEEAVEINKCWKDDAELAVNSCHRAWQISQGLPAWAPVPTTCPYAKGCRLPDLQTVVDTV